MVMLAIQLGTVFTASYFVVARAGLATSRRFVFAAIIGAVLLVGVALPFVLSAPIYGGIVLILAATAIPVLPAGDAIRAGFLTKSKFSLLFAVWSVPLLALATFLTMRLPSGQLTLEQMRSLLPLCAISLATIPVAIYFDLRDWKSSTLGRRIGSVIVSVLLLILFVNSVAQVYWELRRIFS